MIELFRTPKPYFIVFTASACTLIIEIVAGRILAPTIGVSLYTWTSIIGIVLAGISLGNYLGGRLADKYPSPVTLGLILLAGGVASAIRNGGAGRAVRCDTGDQRIGGGLDSGCIRESNYFCIKVRAQDIGDREVRVLYLDALLHSYVDINDPLFLHYPYEKVFGDIATTIAHDKRDMDSLFIGGGYTMPRFLEVMYPNTSVEVVEIDPEVVEVATEYFALPVNTRIISYTEDARTKLQDLPLGKYEFIVGDAFNDVSVPYHLTTLEFNEMVHGLLAYDGVYAINVVDRMYTGRFLRSVVHTLRQTFPHVYVLRDDDRWADDNRYTFVVMAAKMPFSLLEVYSANQVEGRGTAVTQFMPSEEFVRWLGDDRKVVITDDFVPVDGMLAPLYLESR